jgi:hypothetical protein
MPSPDHHLVNRGIQHGAASVAKPLMRAIVLSIHKYFEGTGGNRHSGGHLTSCHDYAPQWTAETRLAGRVSEEELG